jgi:hypothetical protein
MTRQATTTTTHCNLEIYAERQIDPQERETFLDLARGREVKAHERALSRSR